MVLLAIETATHTCGAALYVDDGVVAEAHMHRPRAHARHLTPLIEEVLARAEVGRDEIDVVAVSKGPGSYTGLRIGVSTAKGWAEAVGADLIGVPTLEALAATVSPYAREGDIVCAALDARRDEIYGAAYRVRGGGRSDHTQNTGPAARLTIQAAAAAMKVAHVPDWLGVSGNRVWLLGTGAEKTESALESAGVQVTRLAAEASRPSAAWVARCAAERLRREQNPEPSTFEPMYLKAFQVGG
ncbi:tRNA (adenosine(37)-N6)-threonylcarbamoyltransferase complex dimerization subunit type 1 TsaB [Longibacter sp.]|jgi:tRNA threonylcarbamoyladenosine biosynthesis protein TsaB|uniref:tRNA (adenosine(37)-N6)-threonylcarbamoyltransferase complex dimerization subunit type 1 TsaB n=1 Tax=Longibacter sp. TaxID=2045415 RepID=UPI003EB6E7B6